MVEIVISFRERWSLTEETICSILRNTEKNCYSKITLIDLGMPEEIRESLAKYPVLIYKSSKDTPQNGRSEYVKHINSEFVLFIDNDIEVVPGWLNNLVECAKTTGAAIVCPLYLWGKDGNAEKIHMAGGKLTEIAQDNGYVILEEHFLINKNLATVADELKRKTCDFAEYHCMLMAKKLYSHEDTFKDGIDTVHEHIHASLLAKKLGMTTYLEPSSKVIYKAFASWKINELKLARKRWSISRAESSLKKFTMIWNVVDEEKSYEGVRRFIKQHLRRLDVVEPLLNYEKINKNIEHSFIESIGGLVSLAITKGYEETQITKLVYLYSFMLRLVDGVYRVNGRPFINHLVGVAAILINHQININIVMAGLAHAALTHNNKNKIYKGDILEKINSITGSQSVTELIILYEKKKYLFNLVKEKLRITDIPKKAAEIIIIDTANEIDMHQSYEILLSKRKDLIDAKMNEIYKEMFESMGLISMWDTLSNLKKINNNFPRIKFSEKINGSFYFFQGNPVSALTNVK